MKTPTYTSDWFSHKTPNWQKHLAGFKEKVGVQYLEVGAFEGRSLFWMLENILIKTDSRATAVDIFNPADEKIFLHNLSIHPKKSQVIIKKGFSQEILRELPLNFFDIIYLDGSHMARDVFVDAALSWGLLKEEGILIFDDFLYRKDEYPLDMRPELPISTFLTVFGDNLKVLHQDWQIFVQKRTSVGRYDISRIGDAQFDWHSNTLSKSANRENIVLSEAEISVLKSFFNSKKLGQTTAEINSRFSEDSVFIGLCQRAKIIF